MIEFQKNATFPGTSLYKSIEPNLPSCWATEVGTARFLTPPEPVFGETRVGCFRLSLCFLVFSLAGCGQQLPSVSGSVSLDGEVVRGSDNLQCIVLFFPENGSGAPAIAVVDGSGEFSLDTGSTKGAREGKYDVAITVAEITPNKDGGLPRSRQLAPGKYADPSTSGWSVEVVPGSNEFDFAIEKADQRPKRSNSKG